MHSLSTSNYLINFMTRTMTTVVNNLSVMMDQDEIQDVFFNCILKTPVNEDQVREKRPKSLNEKEWTKLHRKLLFLHKKYNNPDHPQISSVDEFRATIFDKFRDVKYACTYMKNPVENNPFIQALMEGQSLSGSAEDKKVYILENSENFDVPENSSYYLIHTGKNNRILLGEGCKNIKIKADEGVEVQIKDHCSQIEIEMPFLDYPIGTHPYQIGAHCTDIYVNGSKIY